MKNGKRLSRDQKIMLTEAGKNPADYLIAKDLPGEMTLLNRKTGEQETLTKIERRKRK